MTVSSNQGRSQYEQFMKAIIDKQIGRVQPQPLCVVPKLAPDELVCPTCGYPAVALEPDGRPGQRYRHAGRVWDCSSDKVTVVYGPGGTKEVR